MDLRGEIILRLSKILFRAGSGWIIFFSVSGSNSLFASSLRDSLLNDSATKAQKDLKDVALKLMGNKKLPEFGAKKDHNNKSLFLSYLPGFGYSEPTGFYASLSVNGSFYANRDTTNNLSSVNGFVNYTQNKQIILPVISNIWLKGNKYNLSGDWHYYKYPSYTYGLGVNTPISDAVLVDYSYIRVWQTLYRRLYHDLLAGGGYALDYHFNIYEYGSHDFLQIYNLQQQGKSASSVSSGFTANLLYDDRKNPNNPKNGHYANITYRFNLPVLGSDNSWQSLLIDARKYIPFPAHSKSVLALWTYDWFTVTGQPPYLDLPSIGWDANSNTGRGYTQGRFRSRNMLYGEAEYRFGLSHNGLFGGVVFANLQSYSEDPDNKFKSIIPGWGAGLRIKFNKYSDTNAAIDYGIGIGGSRGLLFNLCEVF